MKVKWKQIASFTFYLPVRAQKVSLDWELFSSNTITLFIQKHTHKSHNKVCEMKKSSCGQNTIDLRLKYRKAFFIVLKTMHEHFNIIWTKNLALKNCNTKPQRGWSKWYIANVRHPQPLSVQVEWYLMPLTILIAYR